MLAGIIAKLLVLAILALKLSEILFHFIATARNRTYSAELVEAINRWNDTGFKEAELETLREKHGWPGSAKSWPITGWILRRLGRRSQMLFMSLFRYRWLMTLEIGIIALSKNGLVLWAGMIILLAGIWLGILRLLNDRLVFGYADSYFRRTIARIVPEEMGHPKLPQSRQERARDFITLFCGTVAILIAAYTSVYCAIQRLSGDPPAFQNVPDRFQVMHFLYFSVVTAATVGYGDISPRPDCVLCQMATASEILAGFTLLIVMITSVSLTFDLE